MPIETKPNALSESLNAGNPNTVADALRALKFGNLLLQSKTMLVRVVPVVLAGYDPALKIVKLPEMAKAAKVLSARGYTASAGANLTLQAGDVPATGEVAITGSGDIAVLGADAHVAIDVLYEPAVYDLAELTLPVVSNVLTIPSAYVGLLLIEATAIAATSTGAKIVDDQSDTAPAAGKARLASKSATVLFAAADAVTSARVKLGVARKADVQTVLTVGSAIS
jgi:hypothetical protein